MLPLVAVMTELPVAIVVTRPCEPPALLTVALLVVALVQVTDEVKFCVELSV